VGATILFFAALMLIAVWWLSKHRITSKPWLEQGAAGELPGTGVSAVPVAKIGLGVLLAALGSLFALFISAYLMRMQLVDWRPVPKPSLLWINSGVLLLSSVALQWARAAADRDDPRGVRTGLLAAAAAALGFLIGQVFAWQQLTGTGYGLTANPASSFFYKAWRDPDIGRLRLSLDLCSMYWDFLLLVWLVLFGLLLLT
jgi:cytochrome c oxidase subunit 3